jgi:DNA/RNA-binding domain of Phe-tRNA-synthetase-like protein
MQEYFTVDPACGQKYPGFKAGILVVTGIANLPTHPGIQEMKGVIEQDIRQKFAGYSREDLNKLPVLDAYNQYYKQFDQTYHVRAQVESVINGKSLPTVSALLDSMFAAELKHMLLTAGHDLDALQLPITLTVADGTETYTAINGKEKTVRQGDLYMRGQAGPISSILNGPDSRTKILPETKNALFAIYAPATIAADIVAAELKDMEHSISLFSPTAQMVLLEVFTC